MNIDACVAVDAYFTEQLVARDEALDAALRGVADAGLPAISVSPLQGKLLMMLARMRGARSILEIGTLGGYSTIWLARALPVDGTLVTLEIDPGRAELARRNVDRAGIGKKVEIRVGPAAQTLETLIAAKFLFDFVFIDADKKSTPLYFDQCLKLATPGAVIIVDNVVRNGEVANASSTDSDVQGIRRFLATAGSNPRVTMTAMQTVGSKSYDGFAIATID